MNPGEIQDSYVMKFCSGRICEYQERLNHVNVEYWDTKQLVDYLTTADDERVLIKKTCCLFMRA